MTDHDDEPPDSAHIHPRRWPWRHLVDQGFLRVAFQGERGANSDEATMVVTSACDITPADGSIHIEIMPERTLFEVFAALRERRVTCAVVPVENSHAGSVNDTYDLLLEHHQHAAILAAYNHPVHHCLLALPGQTLTDIQQVYSHPQALAQCAEYLREHGLTPVPEYDTAGSARMIRQRDMAGCAAIASRRAAAIYELEIVAENIQTNPMNLTRFLALGAAAPNDPTIMRDKTSLVFATPNNPGALYRALAPLALSGLNMTRLESRPSRNQPWEYLFYADVEGDVQSTAFATALTELQSLTRLLVVLGSYPILRVL